MRSSLTRIIAASAVALVLVGSTSIAFGHTGPSDRLRLFFGDKGMAVWQSGTDDQGILVDDSPLDSNHARLGLYVPADDTLDVTGTDYDYAGAFAKNTGLAGRTLPRVRNLSFDFLKASAGATVGGGNPRFSIPIDLDGDGAWDGFAFAAAGDCEASIGATWSRADFTGRVSRRVHAVRARWRGVLLGRDGLGMEELRGRVPHRADREGGQRGGLRHPR